MNNITGYNEFVNEKLLGQDSSDVDTAPRYQPSIRHHDVTVGIRYLNVVIDTGWQHTIVAVDRWRCY